MKATFARLIPAVALALAMPACGPFPDGATPADAAPPAKATALKVGQRVKISELLKVFRAEDRAVDYVGLLAADKEAAFDYLETLTGFTEDWGTLDKDQKPAVRADLLNLYKGSTVMVVRVLPEGVAKVMIGRAITDRVDGNGKGVVDANTSYGGEIGYMIIAHLKP